MISLVLGFILGLIAAGSLILFFTDSCRVDYGSQFTGRLASGNDKDISLQSSNRAANAVNGLLQFLFQELKDTGKVRRYFIRKIKMELDELTKRKVLSSIIRNIQIRDFSLGDASPEFSALSLRDCMYDSTGLLQTVQIYTHIKYSFGFSLATTVETLLDKSAVLSFKLNKFESDAYFVLCREPFTHWYLSFCRDPHIEITVSTQVGARNIPQVANLIANQLKKAILRKHTWPAYKIRFRPFFVPPPSLNIDENLFVLPKGKPLTEIVMNSKPFEAILVQVRCLERLADSFADVLSKPKYTAQHQLVVSAMLSSLSVYDELSNARLVENLEGQANIKKIQLPKGIGDQVKLSELEVLRKPVVFVTRVNKALERLLEVGDIILQMNGQPLLSVEQFNSIYHDKGSNGNVTIVVKKVRMVTDTVYLHKSCRGFYAKAQTQVISQGRNNTFFDNGIWDVEEAVRCAMVKLNCWFSHEQISRMKSSTPKVPGKFVNYEEAFVLRPRDSDVFCNVLLLSCTDDMDQTILAYACFTLEEIVSDCDLTLKRECQFSRSLVPTSLEDLRSLGDVSQQQGFATSLAYGHVVMSFRLLNEAELSEIELAEEETTDGKMDSLDLVEECENFTLHELHPFRLETTQYCQICNGKIWMRSALRCQQCGIVCHQKCTSGCYARSCRGMRDLSDSSMMMAKGLMYTDGQLKKRNTNSSDESVIPLFKFGFKEARRLLEDERLYMQAVEIGHHLYLSSSGSESKGQLRMKVDELSKMITKELNSPLHKSLSTASFDSIFSNQKAEKVRSLATLYLVHLSALDELSTDQEVVSSILDDALTRVEVRLRHEPEGKTECAVLQSTTGGTPKTRFFHNVGKFVSRHPNVVTAYSKYKDKMLSRVWPSASQPPQATCPNGRSQQIIALQNRRSSGRNSDSAEHLEDVS